MARQPNLATNETWRTKRGPRLLGEFINLCTMLADIGLTKHADNIVELTGHPDSVAGTLPEVLKDLSGMKDNVFENAHFRSRRSQATPDGTIKGPPQSVRVEVDLERAILSLSTDGFPHEASQTIRSVAERIFPKIDEKNLPSGVPTRNTQLTVATPQAQASGRYKKGHLVDNYRLIQKVGSGRSGEVWRAEVVNVAPGVPLVVGQTVALKLYSPQMLSQHAESIRIQREFQVAADIEHPNLARVYDVVLSPSRRYAFIAMEYVEGSTLKSRIPSEGLGRDTIVAIGVELFEALRELHAERALHRDVKAANIIITSPPGEPIKLKLLDLGIVEIIGDASLTGTSVFMGSKHSAPPEQMLGRDTDERADIYAVGSVLFHCYKGNPMYHKEGPETAIAVEMFRSPARLVPNSKEPADLHLVEFINTCIQVDRTHRPSSAAECMQTLRRLRRRAAAGA